MLPESGSSLEEIPDEGQQQQRIARVGNANAPRVVVDGQDGCILLKSGLEEAVPAYAGDMVHGYLQLAAIGLHKTLVVGSCLRAGIALNLKALQHQRAGKGLLAAVFPCPGGYRFPFRESHVAFFTGDMREERAAQNEGERHMDALREKAFHAAEGIEPADRRYCPEDKENGVVIDPGEGCVAAVQFFKDGGSHHQKDVDCHRPKTNDLKEGFIH